LIARLSAQLFVGDVRERDGNLLLFSGPS